MTSHIFAPIHEDYDFLSALVSVYDSKVQKFPKEVVLQKKKIIFNIYSKNALENDISFLKKKIKIDD